MSGIDLQEGFPTRGACPDFILEYGSPEEATKIIMNDPFVSRDLLESKWIKEWVVEI